MSATLTTERLTIAPVLAESFTTPAPGLRPPNFIKRHPVLTFLRPRVRHLLGQHVARRQRSWQRPGHQRAGREVVPVRDAHVARRPPASPASWSPDSLMARTVITTWAPGWSDGGWVRVGTSWRLLPPHSCSGCSLCALADFPSGSCPAFSLHATGPLLLMGFGYGLLGGGLLEELGWTGFAVRRLRQRYGVLRTGLFVGVLWGRTTSA